MNHFKNLHDEVFIKRVTNLVIQICANIFDWVTLDCSESFLLQVLEFLANPEDDSRHEERQQALMELLQAGGLQQVNEEKLLSMAENAKL